GKISVYNVLLGIIIAATVLPMIIHHRLAWFWWIELVAAAAFLIDYLLRWLTADYKVGVSGKKSFFRYPFMSMAVIDLAAEAVYVCLVLSPSLAERRLFMLLRISSILKLLRYTQSKNLIRRVLIRQKTLLLKVIMIALEYIFITALIIFNAEPETFPNFFEAIYWSTVSLTTVGFGDIYPVSVIGQIITMLSSFFGIAIIAMPAGIITAGFMQELKEE
ncbi:MAG: potassium channel family protein, partial [Lachnospiraceae bacterium]|nr:potassium channel family protein [Lachnospiraceae bacterium]